MQKYAQLRRKAAARLNTYGWTKGEMRNFNGEYCLVGALRAAARNNGGIKAVKGALTAMGFKASTKDTIQDMAMYWNDYDKRTKRAVMTRLLKGL